MWTDGITEVYAKVEELTEENDRLKSEIEKLKTHNAHLLEIIKTKNISAEMVNNHNEM